MNPSEGLSRSNAPACVRACALTARLLADDPVRAVPAGARLPQAAVALDPEAGVGRQHGEGHVVRLPVGVGHLRVLAPHQASTCGGNIHRLRRGTLHGFFAVHGALIHHRVPSDIAYLGSFLLNESH